MTTEPYDLSVKIDGAKNQKNARRYRVVLSLSPSKESAADCPYLFDLQLIGYFRWMGAPPNAQTDTLVLRNAAAILYSASREILASVTGRGPFPALILPMYSFIIDEKEIEASAKRLEAGTLRRNKPAKRPRTAAKKR
jgi:preprotein translocase subunit SecB